MTNAEIESGQVSIFDDRAPEILKRLIDEYASATAVNEETAQWLEILEYGKEPGEDGGALALRLAKNTMQGLKYAAEQVLANIEWWRRELSAAGFDLDINSIVITCARRPNNNEGITQSRDKQRRRVIEEFNASKISEDERDTRLNNIDAWAASQTIRIKFEKEAEQRQPPELAQAAANLKVINNAMSKRLAAASTKPLLDLNTPTPIKAGAKSLNNLLAVQINDQQAAQVLTKNGKIAISGIKELLHDAAFTLYRKNGKGCFITPQRLLDQALQHGTKNYKSKPEALDEASKAFEATTRMRLFLNIGPEQAARIKRNKLSKSEIDELLNDPNNVIGEYYVNADVVLNMKTGKIKGWILNGFALENVADMNHQIVTIPQDMAKIKTADGKTVRKDLTKTAIVRYLYLRIIDMQNTTGTRNVLDRTILMSSVYTDAEIINPGKDREYKLKTFIKQVLDYWTAKGTIDGYKITNKTKHADPKIIIGLPEK